MAEACPSAGEKVSSQGQIHQVDMTVVPTSDSGASQPLGAGSPVSSLSSSQAASDSGPGVDTQSNLGV